jgi:ribokinase
MPLVAIGGDADGARYRAACAEAGLSTELVVESPHGRTPCCILVHHSDGRATSFIDPGPAAGALNRTQRDAINQADLVVLCADDPVRTREVLALVPPDRRVAWIVKGDSASVPAALGGMLAMRADIIVHNSGERAFFTAMDTPEPKAERIVIETIGAGGVVVRHEGADHRLDVRRVDVEDTTGAGDTFAGEVLAALLAGKDVLSACRQGIGSTSAFLEERALAEAARSRASDLPTPA